MSDQVNVGDYSLEISGDEVVVRDESGAIVETVDLDDVDGELTLPDGQKIDLASILADSDLENFQTAAGPANDNTGSVNGGAGIFTPFHTEPDKFGGLDSAGTLGGTSLSFDALNTDEKKAYDPNEEVEAPILVTWNSHDGWQISENQSGGSFGKVVSGNPADFTFEVSDDRFEIVDGILQVRDGVSFDYETESGIDIEVKATSRSGDVQTVSIHIGVTDVNEAQTELVIDGKAANENAAGAIIGSLTVADPDQNDTQTFEVSDDRFEIVNGQLKLKDGASLDHESEPTVDVTLTATDGAGNQIQRTFTINVGDVNEAPTAIDLSGNTLVENAAGAVVGTLSAIDPDAGDTHSFEVSDDRFEVVNGQLKLKDGVSLDFEDEPSLDVVVTATDSAGNKVQETFTLSLGDTNEAQTALMLDQNQVAENVSGAVIGTLSVADPDGGDSQTFQVSDSRLEVVNGQLKLKDGVSLDFETEPTVKLQVTATDKGGNQITENFTVNIGNVNETQTALTLSKSTVVENAKGAVIGAVSVIDPDAGDKQSFTVSDSRFQIVNGQLKLKSGVSINYEAEPEVDVTVTATDTAGHKISQTFTIDVTNVNEKQTAMALSSATVTENDKGAIIGTLNVSDPDAGDVQSFKVSDNRFEVVDGQLKLKDGVSLNYESAANVKVKVTATDTGGNQISKTFTINVQDVNEAQTKMTLSGTKVSENAAGAVIGTLKVTDPDKGDTQTFSVSDDRFEVVSGQLKLKDGISLNFEEAKSLKVSVTATDTAGHDITKTFTIGVGNVNEAQTGMTLSASKVTENAAGALIGTLKVTDPDAGDKQSFTVSDSRFEVVNNKLKLKDGVSLDFEQGATVDVDVTATDKGGNQITRTFSISVGDVNEAQTALTIDQTQVPENAAGAVIGTLTVADPDAGDSQSFKVSDSRFEVVNGQLKLKGGIALDHENESSVNLTVTATDKAGHQISQAFSIDVANVNEAPAIKSTHGTAAVRIVNTSESYDPQASEAAGDYLYGTKGASLSKSHIASGVSTEALTLFAPTDVTVTFQKEGAGYHNMVGVYQFDDNGNIIPGSVKFVWLDATASTENKIGAPLVKDFLGYSQPGTVSLGTLPEGTHVGFFTIANGASDNGNKALLASAATGAANQAAAMDAIASQLSIKIDANGNGHVYVGNSQLSGDTYFTHDKSLNTDFTGGNDINHAIAGVSDKLPGQLLIGFEDLKGGGDQDYNDLVFSVGMGTYNINKMTQQSVQPTVDFSDVDGSTLAQAVIQTSGFQAGDTLNVPPSSDFNVTISQSGADLTITIVGKTSNETLDQYEDFANSIYFSTSSKVEGQRHIDYTITDSGGLTSNVSTADIGVIASYEISSSQLDSGRTTLGSGNDLLHINTSSIGPTDLGDGYDTVHLAKHGASFGHQEAIKLENVEAIDTTGYGANRVSLSIHDVLNMTDGDNRLTIIGEQGDSVTLTSSGNAQWTVVEVTQEFTTYAYSDPSMQAVVEISNQMNAQVS
ncbi:DUF4114 domain-containing protein [Dongia deserti]|uniref:DUF4114 domain-containing protein n=1 Tax=Dongia deserti TaxID=2268030 RepID=UPI000E656458|nr:DUF4114 domain-containing protein [Dongia deserti]